MIIEGERSVFLGGQARVLGVDDRELAWAEHHVVANPGIKFILGKYVEGDAANDNGHIFASKELESAQHTLLRQPLNLLHHPHYIVGSFIATEMVYPMSATAVAGVEVPANPIMEALSGMWRYYFPDEFAEVEKAHNIGALWYSMETIPKTVTCTAVCGNTYDYHGRASDTYCDHLNEPGAIKNLNQPHFMGGALILPPARPGWKGADITEMSALVRRHEDEAARVYESLKADLPHLNARTWEEMMMSVLHQSFAELDGGEWAKRFSPDERKSLAAKGHALPDGSYPITDPESLADAIASFGRANPADRGHVKTHIIKRAKALGKVEMIPNQWDV